MVMRLLYIVRRTDEPEPNVCRGYRHKLAKQCFIYWYKSLLCNCSLALRPHLMLLMNASHSQRGRSKLFSVNALFPLVYIW